MSKDAQQDFQGGCLCGAIKFSVQTKLKRFYFCHCKQCQQITGSAFASNLLTEPAAVNWLSGEAQLKRFDYPNRSFSKVFCRECGSGLPFLNISGSTLFIPAGCLDDAPTLRPDQQIFWSEHADWLAAGLEADKSSGFPGK